MPVGANDQMLEKEKKGGEKNRCELEVAMGFEPHSVAGSALKLASQLRWRGPAPSCPPHERGTPLSESPVTGLKSHQNAVLYIGAGDGI
jgi:hypothetical protein